MREGDEDDKGTRMGGGYVGGGKKKKKKATWVVGEKRKKEGEGISYGNREGERNKMRKKKYFGSCERNKYMRLK
jgi:hypothetical protein